MRLSQQKQEGSSIKVSSDEFCEAVFFFFLKLILGGLGNAICFFFFFAEIYFMLFIFEKKNTFPLEDNCFATPLPFLGRLF